MIVGQFSAIFALLCANIATASIVINSHKYTKKTTETATKFISAESKLDKQPHSGRPRFKVAEQPILEHIESITNSNQSFPVYRSTVQRDVNDEDEAHGYNEKEWLEYMDDGDDYDDDGNKYKNTAKQNYSINGKATKKLELNMKDPKQRKMETLHVHQPFTGYYRNDDMVGLTTHEFTPFPRAHVIQSPSKVAPSRIHTPLPANYRTYSSDSCGRTVSLRYKPNFPHFGYANHPYNYYHYCNECYSICNCAYY